MKRFLLFLTLVFCCKIAFAQLKATPEVVVRDFVANLNEWCQDGEAYYHERIKNLCDPSVRFSDEIGMERAEYRGKDQDMGAYLNIYAGLLHNNTRITVENVKEIQLTNCRTQENPALRAVQATLIVRSDRWSKKEKTIFYVNAANKISYMGDYDAESCVDCACDAPFEVTDMEFYFKDKDRTTTQWGVLKADSGACQWVYARIKIKSNRPFKKFPLLKKIHEPNGRMMHCASCGVPQSYTASDTLNISEGEKWYELLGFGYSNESYDEKGIYRYAIWYGNHELISRTFEIARPYATKVSVSTDRVDLSWKGNQKELIAVYSDGPSWKMSWNNYSGHPYDYKYNYGIILEPQINRNTTYTSDKDSATLRITSGKIHKDIKVYQSKTPAIIPSDDWKIGVGYSYSSLYPVNTAFPLALNFNFIAEDPNYYHWKPTTAWMRFISYGVEAGVNFDAMEYPLNSDAHTSYDPKAYLVFIPGVYLHYFTIQCGLGMMFGNYDQSAVLSTSFMIQPAFVGHIPVLDDDCAITIKLGYNIVPHLPEMNGISLGVGFQFSEALF